VAAHLTTLVAATTSSAANAHASRRFVVSTLVTNNFGTILQSSRTVYTLTPSKVPCTATCLVYWPEVLLPKGTTRATAGHGVNPARLGTIKRPGGRLQVTYQGRALYWFSFDKAPGQVKGNVRDTWGKWSVVVVKPAAKGQGTASSTGGGGGIGF
jgi:predicted lipoprotein with Yx(FWY)xxD motif